MKKITVEDFSTKDKYDDMIAELGSINGFDSEGFSPLCFAVLNNVVTDWMAEEQSIKSTISYMCDTSHANPSLKCNKGKTPLQYACLAMNGDATSALLNKGASVSDKDILGAAILPKPDCLTAILNNYTPSKLLYDIKDSEGNNPLHLASMNSCYDSVRELQSKFQSSFVTATMSENDDQETPYDIASANEDIGLLNIFMGYDAVAKTLDDLYNFEKTMCDTSSSLLMPAITNVALPSNIYGELNKTSYNTIRYKPDGESVTINFPEGTAMLDYVEASLPLYSSDANISTNLYTKFITGSLVTLTAQKIGNGSNEFPLVSKKCYNILNLLHSNGKLNLKINNVVVANAADNKSVIESAILSGELDNTKLEDLPWWE